MTFVVEDGSALADANAYISVAEFRTHHTDRGTDTTAHEDEGVEAAIVRATDYTDRRWQFRGDRQTRRQSLAWPRVSAYNDSGQPFPARPRQLIKAVAEYSWLVLNDTDLDTEEVPASLTRRTEKVGPIEDTAEYNPAFTTYRHPQADRWLRELTSTKREVLRG